ncbi:MAG: MBL fold metallo-hydrolase, partial [Chloroflexi bacterium]|nr:MBL fold metallo-hydrolase [Chloroflexota bacterium]
MGAESYWFDVRWFPHAITMIREPHHSEDVKSYLVEGVRDVAVIDSGLGVDDFAALVARLSGRHPRLVQTHAHWDHIGASHRFVDVHVHPSEADALRQGITPERYNEVFWRDAFDHTQVPAKFDTCSGVPGIEPSGLLEDGNRIDLGGRELEVIHTPGHSPGGVSFLDRRARALFCGDLLYLGQMCLF